jgi:3-hydroxybutyryl-CoA dehydratase
VEFAGTTIDDIPIGHSVRVSKTVGETDIYLFAGITGDFDPNHVDEEFCKTTSFGHRIAHGALIVGYMSTASTKILEDFGSPLVSAGFDRIRFTRPVFIGDTVTVEYRITDIDRDRKRVISSVEAKNQNGETVAIATHIQQIVA